MVKCNGSESAALTTVEVSNIEVGRAGS
ncbi:hypothetical protein TNCT_291311, partial [Trichonephila clavata]